MTGRGLDAKPQKWRSAQIILAMYPAKEQGRNRVLFGQ